MTSLKKLLPALALGIAAIPAFAGDEPALDKADTAWIMVAGLLVLFMTIPGIALFYAGMVRKKNMLSTLAQSVATCKSSKDHSKPRNEVDTSLKSPV